MHAVLGFAPVEPVLTRCGAACVRHAARLLLPWPVRSEPVLSIPVFFVLGLPIKGLTVIADQLGLAKMSVSSAATAATYLRPFNSFS